MSIQEIVAGLTTTGFVGAIGLLLRSRSQNRKDQADAAAVLTDAAGRFVVNLEKRIRELEQQLDAALGEVSELRETTRGLLAQVNECHRQHPPLRRVL